MSITPAAHRVRTVRHMEGRFYIAMAIVALIITVAGFGPALVNTSTRKAPLTLAVAMHGVIFAAWLLLFLVQTNLVRRGQIAVHRRLGYAGAVMALLMVISGYGTAIAMARRGFDLSGDLTATTQPLPQLAFALGDLLSFAVLVTLAIVYRKRADVHKRLMLLATVGALMPASLAHIIGHFAFLREIEAPIILVPLIALLFAGAVQDRLVYGRIHPVSLWVALALFVWANVRAAVIALSNGWQEFAAWLTQ